MMAKPAKKAAAKKEPRKAVKVKSTVKRKPVVPKKPVERKAPVMKKPVLPPIDVASHTLVPKHETIGDKEKEEVLKRLQATIKEMPRISLKDPALRGLDAKLGDVIKITRKSYTAGKAVYYRVVSNV